MLRTHTCNELNINNLDKEVILCGWVHRRRDHGKLIFIDLRDRYGITQVVFFPDKKNPILYERAQTLRSEFVISVKGKVGKRPKGNENPNIATGEIELQSLELQILNTSETPPFEIDENLDITEELRLKYRYLDLRRCNVLNNLITRSNVCNIIRKILLKENFVEVETPILTKSTPEGARDYLVPSRLNPGHFYALPQSPQLFKQILMVGGMDRYFQIAKCFRDEDLRADRQPEFTQLDLEMSFVDENDIYCIIEEIFKQIFKLVKGIDIKTPFRKITYDEAISKYNSDKPDLRPETKEEFSFTWIVDFPLFKYNEDEKRWESEHHPFTAPAIEELDKLCLDDLSKIKSRSYDLVLNGQEIGSGSIRIHSQDLQEKIFEIIGINKEEAKVRFGFMLEAFKYGAPPHGGFAFGLDRLLAILCNSETIRNVIAFPKTQKAACSMTEAPSTVDIKQLKELGIDIK
ncbi:MAG: aspartate--tRNA ligase [Candidatus Omnitrophota bacterium]